jgi:beta-N-acetylhexosaminidase
VQNLRYAVPARLVTLACVTALGVTACGGSDVTAPAETGATAAPTTEPAPTTSEPTTGAPEQTCVTRAYEELTEDQRLGQLLMIGFDTNAPLESLDDEIAESHVGNVIYLGGWEGFEKVRSTSEHLEGLVSDEATGGIGLIIAADQEGGIVHQLRGDGFTQPPRALDQAQQSPAELTDAAAGWGEEIASAGVNLNLAPVADTVPEEIGRANEPIGRWGRQFGSDPTVVGEYVAAFLEGMSQAGVEGIVKHFPGLGRVTGNTDFTAEGIEDAVATVDDPFLDPFVAGMDAGASMVMMSSALYPNIDPDNQALYSSAVVTDLLRDRLGWDGVVITDDVNAAALADIPAGERAVRFIGAGGDIVLNGDPGATSEMLDAIRAEMAADPDFAEQVEASVTRVLTLKDEMGLLPCSEPS